MNGNNIFPYFRHAAEAYKKSSTAFFLSNRLTSKHLHEQAIFAHNSVKQEITEILITANSDLTLKNILQTAFQQHQAIIDLHQAELKQ